MRAQATFPVMEHVKQAFAEPLSATLFTERFWWGLIQMHPFEYTLSPLSN